MGLCLFSTLFRYFLHRFSSSSARSVKPNSRASGTYSCRVALAFLVPLSMDLAAMVWRLCTRSQSLTRMAPLF